MKIHKVFALTVLLFLITSMQMFPQILRGTHTARRVGVMRGNQVRTVFTNYGAIGQPGNQGPMVAWKYDNNGYVGDISPLVGVRLPIKDYLINGKKDGNTDTLVQVITCPIDRGTGGLNQSPDGSTDWTFEPIPGFFNPNLSELGKGVAISNMKETWPSYWPDHPDWVDDKGKVQWNGYFGRGEMNADQEAFFMMDDQADEKMYRLHGFLPDSTDGTRKGQALRVSVRALQWANFLAQDVIFWLYDVKNVGTSIYDQTVFGILVGTYVGGAGDEWNDDASYFDIRQSMTYSWDFDHYVRPTANARWQPSPSAVGYLGYAFLESPGNPYDGIDNDGDNSSNTVDAPYFTANDFTPHTVKAGDKLVVIDKYTYKRTSFAMPAHDTTVISMGVSFNLIPDSTVLEEGNLPTGSSTVNINAYDGIDNNLNGIIDENYELNYRLYKETSKGVVLIDSLNPIQHKDFVNQKGLTDPMIDEARDDGIDNDRTWDMSSDDIGIDGVSETYDYGESDGKATSGWQKEGVIAVPAGKKNLFGLIDSGEPGEPNIDKTDVHESDQIGMTSFYYFVPSSDLQVSDQKDMWRRLQPGRFDVPEAVVNNRTIRGEDGDFIFGSGYFPLLPGETERFSLALVFGEDFSGVFRNKKIAQIIYDANYNFPKPPDKPTLTAVPGDNKVTLYWDKIAEKTYDKALKKRDFEGYKIYKSNDADFSDIKTISNGYGELVDYKPLVQYDLSDGVKGFFNSDPLLYELSSGKPFYLGDDTGIKNTYVDYDVINGKTYYYALCAYNTGDQVKSIYPSENTKLISQDASGNVTVDINTAIVVPNAPIAGYVAPVSGIPLTRVSGASTSVPVVQVVDPTKVKNTTYYVTFTDSLIQGVSVGYAYSVVDSSSGDTLLFKDTNLLSTNGDIFNGINLSINSVYQVLDSLRLDTTQSGWNNKSQSNLNYTISQYKYGTITGVRCPYDYMFVFHDAYKDSSSTLQAIFGSNSRLKVVPTNFSVFDITDKSNPVKIEYAFIDKSGAGQDTLSNFDVVYLSNHDGTQLSWGLTFQGTGVHTPAAGDTLVLTFQKPFSSKDKFIYRSKSTQYNSATANASMSLIRAVPNPYVVSNMFEKPLPSTERGRGSRVVDFINLPPNSKISIYNSSGEMVRTIYHNGNYQSGSATWDLRSKEGLDVAFGVYFYVVEAPRVKDKKFGKLAIIK